MAGKEDAFVFCIFIHESLEFRERKDLGISTYDSEILSIKITNKTKNIILSSVYRPPESSLKKFESFLKQIFDNIRRNNNDLHLVGDFNIEGPVSGLRQFLAIESPLKMMKNVSC